VKKAKASGRRFSTLVCGAALLPILPEAGVLEQTAMEFTGNKDIATHRAYRQLTLTNLKNAAKKLEEQTAK